MKFLYCLKIEPLEIQMMHKFVMIIRIQSYDNYLPSPTCHQQPTSLLLLKSLSRYDGPIFCRSLRVTIKKKIACLVTTPYICLTPPSPFLCRNSGFFWHPPAFTTLLCQRYGRDSMQFIYLWISSFFVHKINSTTPFTVNKFLFSTPRSMPHTWRLNQ